MHKLILKWCIAAICFIPLPAFAQNNADKVEIIEESVEVVPVEQEVAEEDEAEMLYVPDTGLIVHKVYINRDTLDDLKASKKFGYHKNLDSLLRAWQKEYKNQSENDADLSWLSKLFTMQWLKYVLWFVAFLFVIFILYAFVLNKGFFMRGGKKIVSPAASTEDEIFLEKDFIALKNKSLQAGDYRMATRYMFLHLLNGLNNKGLISFGIDKTNRQYFNELPVELKKDFGTVSRTYEYVWYGNHELSQDTFAEIENTFRMFNLSAGLKS